MGSLLDIPRTEPCVTKGYDDRRDASDKRTLDCVSSMEMGAFRVGSLGRGRDGSLALG